MLSGHLVVFCNSFLLWWSCVSASGVEDLLIYQLRPPQSLDLNINLGSIKACKIKFELRVIFEFPHSVQTSARVWAVKNKNKICLDLRKSLTDSWSFARLTDISTDWSCGCSSSGFTEGPALTRDSSTVSGDAHAKLVCGEMSSETLTILNGWVQGHNTHSLGGSARQHNITFLTQAIFLHHN